MADKKMTCEEDCRDSLREPQGWQPMWIDGFGARCVPWVACVDRPMR